MAPRILTATFISALAFSVFAADLTCGCSEGGSLALHLSDDKGSARSIGPDGDSFGLTFLRGGEQAPNQWGGADEFGTPALLWFDPAEGKAMLVSVHDPDGWVLRQECTCKED